MKFIHLSDLHIGKHVNGFPMLDDQKYILEKILGIAGSEAPDAVIIAGDVYDKPLPSAEAVSLFDDFLYKLSEMVPAVLVISGNHDSPERIAFASRLVKKSGVYISPVYDGNVEPVRLEDRYGSVYFYLLPFIKPSRVRFCFPGIEIDSVNKAVEYAVRQMHIGPDERNILVTHQFVTGGVRCESEEISVGGSEGVSADIFEGFDYVALGHLHGPQNVRSANIRYCGSPIKYSFSEAKHKKSVTVVELARKNELSVSMVPLVPRRDMIEIKGPYAKMTERSFYRGMDRNAYYHVTLTDENDIPDAAAKLRSVYKNLMRLDYDNARTRNGSRLPGSGASLYQSPLELFCEFYKLQNGKPVSEAQKIYIAATIKRIWEGER